MKCPCCTWETFKESFDDYVFRENYPAILIDDKKVRRCWNFGMTGYEAFFTATREEKLQALDIKNAEYLKKLRRNPND